MNSSRTGAREHLVETAGRRLYVREDGDPRGTPVVIHHGTPGAPLFWHEWANDALRRGLRLISFARPGYAGSTRLPDRLVADMAADSAAVADALGIGRFVTWGVSGGGPHALACAALLPDRVAAAATVDGLAPWDAEGLTALDGMVEDNVAEFTAALEGRGTLEKLIDPTAAAMAGADRQTVLGQLDAFLDPYDAEVAAAGFGELLVDSFRLGLRDGAGGWIDDDLAFVNPWGFDLSAVSCPIGVWHGELDSMVPSSHGRWLAARLRAAQVRIHPHGGHLEVVANRIGEVHSWLARFR